MITPNDIIKMQYEDACVLDTLEKEIDAYITEHRTYTDNYAFAVIRGEYPEKIREDICKRYRDAGWGCVYHSIGSERKDFDIGNDHTFFKFYKSVPSFKDVNHMTQTGWHMA